MTGTTQADDRAVQGAPSSGVGMQRRRRPVYTLIVYMALLVALGIFVLKKQDAVLHQLSLVSVEYLPLLFVLMGLHLVLNAFRFKLLLRVFGVETDVVEWFGLTVSGTMVSYCVPGRGGFAVRALYLKQEHGLSFTSQASLMAGASLIFMLLSAGVALALLWLDYLIHGEWLPRLFLLIAWVFIGTLVSILLVGLLRPAHVRCANRRLRRIAGNFVRGLRYFRKKRALVLALSLVHLASVAVFGLRLFFAFRALGVAIHPLRTIMIQSLTDFSGLLSLTPGNLGIKEGIIVFLSTRFDISTEAALLAAAIDRAVGLVVTVVFGAIFSHFLARRYARGEAKRVRAVLRDGAAE